MHKAVREAFVNLIIHSDYQLDAGTLKIIKNTDGFEFANPGILKLPIEEIFKGGNSKPRNPRMQTMFRMVGFGDNAGSGFPAILDTWKKAGWIVPELIEDAVLNQVTLILKTIAEEKKSAEKSAEKSVEKQNDECGVLSERQKQILNFMKDGVEYRAEEIAENIGLKGARTRQLLNQLVEIEKIRCTAATKNRRYIKIT